MPRTSTDLAPVALSFTVWSILAATQLVVPPPPADATDVATLPLRSALALGVPERGATLAWWQVGRVWASGADLDPDALVATVDRIGALDPGWRTPWIYGGLMLQTQGGEASLAAAHDLLAAGAVRWPDDPWFPAALGVQLQDQGRIEEARAWLREARERS